MDIAQNSGMTSTRVTLAAVAEHAGVSVATASRGLRGRGEMAAATRARIVRSAAELGYRAGQESRGRPRSGTARTFDLVLGRFHDPYTAEITAGARAAAAAHGYDLTLTADREDPDDDWMPRILSRGSAGVIVGLRIPTASQIEALRRADIPLVLMEPPSESPQGLPSVRTTDREGGAAAAAHLVERGAERFVSIGGTPSYRFGRARMDGFREVLARAAPEASRVHVSADWTAWGARRACSRGLEEVAAQGGSGLIGVFACNDEMAAGAYRAVADAGLSIPRHVLVVGFDDVRGARWLHPPLTTLRQPIGEMAAAAVGILVRAVGGEAVEDESVVMPTELVARGSTAAAGIATGAATGAVSGR